MVATNLADATPFSGPPGLSRLEGNLVEMMVLLPQDQAMALEAAAHGEGLTVGQLVRRLVRQFTQPMCLGREEADRSPDRWIG
jgi:hypothetical protein